MQERPVVVREGGNNTTVFGIVALVLIAAAVALFVWQPWSANHTTTNIITQPAGGGAGNASSGTSGGAGTSGGSAGTSGTSGGTSGSSSSGGSSSGGSGH